MCIAILNTKTMLPDEYIKNSWDNNDQGAGLLWNDSGVLKTYKTFNYKSFLKKYKEVRRQTSGKIVLHFRIATSGYRGKDNLHPFLVNQDLGFVHNGVISGLGNNKHSDTYQFNEMLKQLPPNFLSNKTIIEFISNYISSSKLVFLDALGNHTIVNEKLGHWAGDDWFSNTSYQSYNDYYWAGNKKVAKSYGNSQSWMDYYYKPETKAIAPNQSYKDDIRYYFDDVTDQEIERFIANVGAHNLTAKQLIDEIQEWAAYYGTYSLLEINNVIEQEYAF